MKVWAKSILLGLAAGGVFILTFEAISRALGL